MYGKQKNLERGFFYIPNLTPLKIFVRLCFSYLVFYYTYLRF